MFKTITRAPFVLSLRGELEAPWANCLICGQPEGEGEIHIDQTTMRVLLNAGRPSKMTVVGVLDTVSDLLSLPRHPRTQDALEEVVAWSALYRVCNDPSSKLVERKFVWYKAVSSSLDSYEILLRAKMSECPNLGLSDVVKILNPSVSLEFLSSETNVASLQSAGLLWRDQGLPAPRIPEFPESSWGSVWSRVSRLSRRSRA